MNEAISPASQRVNIWMRTWEWMRPYHQPFKEWKVGWGHENEWGHITSLLKNEQLDKDICGWMRPYHQPLKEWIVGWEWMRSYHHSLKVNSWTRTWGWMSIYHQPLKEWIVKISDHNRKGEDTNDAITNLAIQWEVGDPFLFVSVGSLEEKKLTVSILERNNFKPMVCNTLLHVRREDFKVAITAHLRFEIFLILVEISPSNSNFSNFPRV